MVTPILILTRDNPEYLYVTLKSLTATELKDNPILIIDDSSELELTKKFYSTMDEFDVTFDDWTKDKKSQSTQEEADKTIAKTFLAIPQIKKIKGIKRKFQVISTPKILGPKKIIQFALKTCFTIFSKADTCCIIDDNILFNKYWLKEALSLYEDMNRPNNKIGIISTYSEELIIPEYRYKIDSQMFRGKMMLISREMYKEMFFHGYFEKNVEFFGNEPNFVELERIGYSLGYITIVSGPSYIQSLEKRNLATKEKLLKYQNNFKRPIAWNKNMI